MRGRTVRTYARADRFLGKIARGYSIAAACRAEGIGRSTFYDWLAADPAFAKAYANAIDDGTDLIEDVARKKAIEGDNTMIALMLKARRPEKFRDPTDTGGSMGSLIAFAADWMPIRATIFAALASHPDALADVAERLNAIEATAQAPGDAE